MRRHFPALLPVALVAVLAAGPGRVAPVARPDAAVPVATAQVDITNYLFDAQELTVAVGTRVTWTNRDEVPHTVTSFDKRFASSGALDAGDRYSYTFTAAGTYEYYCAVHPFMTGKVVVVAASGGRPAARPRAGAATPTGHSMQQM